MARSLIVTTVVAALLIVALPLYGAERSVQDRLVRTVVRPVPSTPDTATTAGTPAGTPVQTPTAGETIDWQVMAGGGADMASGSIAISGTLGQSIVGVVAGAPYEVVQGFWQNFSTNCCVGVTGNANMAGIIDLSDLSLLILYLTEVVKPTLPCWDEANVDGRGIIDLTDLSWMISYITEVVKPVLPACP